MTTDIVPVLTRLCLAIVKNGSVRYSDVIDALISILIDNRTINNFVGEDELASIIGELEAIRVKKGGASVESR